MKISTRSSTNVNVVKLLFTLSALFLLNIANSQNIPARLSQAFKQPPTPPGGGNGNGAGGNNNSNGHTPGPKERIYSLDEIYNAPIFTPTAWGSTKSFAFIQTAGTPIQSYGAVGNPDMVAQIGGGFGNADEIASVAGFVSIDDVSKFSNFSYNLIVSKSLGDYGSISAGGIHLFANQALTDAPPSYYVAYSRAVAAFGELEEGTPRLAYTIGVGTGRFLKKMSYDVETGRGSTGTGVFGNVSYSVLSNLAVSAEWTGTNLALSSSFKISDNLPSIFVGVGDLTRYSGDKPVFMIGIGHAISFSK